MASEMSPVPDDLDFGVTVRGLVVTQKVFGRYTLKHVLGRGGMGVVWLAVDERLEREVALKFLPEIVNFDAAALDDLKRETRRCLDLTHPNIIRIYDFVKDPQAAAISMEYIDGKTLSALRIEKEKRMFEVNEIRDWVAQACQALHYAHQEVKVVHRDLKPANLMITSRNSLKIADFGIARSVSDSVSQVTMKTGTSGTLVYMSPQQMNGDMSRVTDDIYALGATIYELLTSRPPFYSGDIPYQVRQTIPRKLSERREELQIEGEPIPQEWEDAIAACLDKMPEGRPQDTFDLAQRLGLHSTSMMGRSSTVVNSLSPPSSGAKPPSLKPPATKKPKPPPGPKPPRKPFPTKPVLTYAGGALGVVLLGWLLWAFVLWPFIATPGTVTVGSTPAGATVHLSGQQDGPTPITFSKVRVGGHKLIVSMDGYDPYEETVRMTEGGSVDRNVTLTRAFGRLNISTIPPKAHYELTGTTAATRDTDREGATPDYLASVPSGSYQLTLSSSGLSDRTVTIDIPAHATLDEKDDLIALDLASNSSSADAGKALLGQESSGSLDTNGKAAYAGLLRSAFEKYLAAGQVTPASDTINKLKGIGQDTSAQDKELAGKRASIEKAASEQIGDLISDKKFATAQATLDDLKGQIDDDSLAQLKTQYQPQLDQYAQQVDGAIKLSQDNSDVNAAYAQLTSFAEPYSDDLKLQLALATLETRMPPDHDRLTARLKSFHALAAANRDVVENSDFQAMQDKFTKELSQLDALAAALDSAKNGGGSLESQLSDLEDERAEISRKSVGDQAAASVVNFLSRNTIGRNVLSEADKESELRDNQAKIDNVKQEIAAQNSNSDDAVTQTQRNYDAFVARVPW